MKEKVDVGRVGVKNRKEVDILMADEEEENRRKKLSLSKKEQTDLTRKRDNIIHGNEHQM